MKSSIFGAAVHGQSAKPVPAGRTAAALDRDAGACTIEPCHVRAASAAHGWAGPGRFRRKSPARLLPAGTPVYRARVEGCRFEDSHFQMPRLCPVSAVLRAVTKHYTPCIISETFESHARLTWCFVHLARTTGLRLGSERVTDQD